jgi:mannose-1-phosphate guanylyltransferase/phosphomannomutase
VLEHQRIKGVKLTGVIMAGGFGTRLKPLTCNIPKPMVPMLNRPMMEHVVLLLKKHGIHKIVSLLFHQPQTIKQYFKNGHHLGVEMLYQINTEDFGTAGSLKQAERFLNESILVISGDLLTDIDLNRAIEFHQQKKNAVTLVLTRVKNPLEYGIVMTNESGQITRFLEKPAWGQVFSDTINTGIYILEPEILQYIPSNEIFDFSKDLFPLLMKKKIRLFGYITNDYWRDVGNLREYQQAHWDALNGTARLELPGTRYREAWFGENSDAGENFQVEGPVLIGNRCKIGKNVFLKNSVIGDDCRIGDDSNIINSILWNNVMIEQRATLESDVIASNVQLKENAYIAENAFISENCVLGKNSTIRPNVKIWPNKHVEDGAVVTSSLIWGDRWLRELFTEARITGLSNAEITPEFGAKLGAAFGAMFGINNSVIVGRDAAESSRMISQAIASGFMAAGVDVHDLRNMPIPIVRYQLRSSVERAGIYVRKSPFDERLTDILVFDDDGRDLPTNKTKSIERLFFREDFRRANYDQIGKIDFPVRQVESYSEDFLTHLDLPQIEKARFRIVVDYSHGGATMLLPQLLGSLGCEVISLNAYLDSTKLSRDETSYKQSLVQLSNIVTSLGADIGFLIDAGAEKVSIIDEKGRYIDGDRLLVLITSILTQINHLEKIAVPVTASSQIEKMAEPHGIQVLRTANDHRSLVDSHFLQGVKFAGDTKGGFIFTQFQFAYDGMFAMAKILEIIARTNSRLGRLHDNLPQLALRKVNLPCSWEKKGYIMRRLMETTENMERELIDGVKIFQDESWVIVLPDRTRPLFHINAESPKPAISEALVTRFSQNISNWISEK